LLALVLLPFSAALAGPALGPWTPLFKGIDHAVGTNNPSIPGDFPELQVVHCVRVDLTDPDVQFFTTPRATNYVAESRETLTLSIPDFVRKYQIQVAADANFYNANPGGDDPTSEGLPCEVYGLQICTGVVVSAQSSADYDGDPRAASLLFTTNKQPVFVFENLPPGTNTAGICTAITGYYPIVSNGVNFGIAASNSYSDSSIHGLQPRTAYGVSQDNHYFYMLTIDGRQSGYSDGAYDVETGCWMTNCGAWNAINMDGGGSTALYMSDSTGNPVALNHSSYLLVTTPSRERYIGSHFGVFARPVPGFFTNLTVLPADTAATLTWTTLSAATTQLAYGTTTNLNLFTASNATLTASHAVLLTNLTPSTSYYYAALASIGVNTYTSSTNLFTTTNYVTASLLFDFTNTWSCTADDLDGVNWTASSYDDSGWEGSGPGLLWADLRGPNSSIPGLNTEMPLDADTGYPYITYYFRTHFNFTNSPAGVALQLQAYVDDGALFYLNGTQIWSLRMPAPPVLNATLAAGYPCSGDATCIDANEVSGPVITNSLVTGDNVLAVEVHNYNALSPDITFGLAVSANVPYSMNPMLNVAGTNRAIALNWAQGGFTLQQAGAVTGPWTNVPGPVVSSPFITTDSASARFFRLIK
jgi:exopolysaccharide biosynthesis protein